MIQWLKDRLIHTIAPEALRPSSVFRSGEGYSPWHIRCEDPCDLGPPADLILCAIKGTRAEMEASGDTRPLVVLLGNSHNKPAHMELQKAVMNRLLTQKLDFSWRLEHPHNDWATITEEVTDIPVPAELRYDCSQFDPEGRAALSALTAYFTPHYAPVAFSDIAAFCLQREIKTVFNDAAMDLEYVLDFNDPATRKAANALHFKISNAITANDSVGMAIRNRVMADGPFERKLILQSTGIDHIFGRAKNVWDGVRRGFPFTESLTAAYEKAEAHVLPVFLTSSSYDYGLNVLPREAYGHLPGTVLIDGLSDKEFFSKKHAARYNLPHREDAEKQFITEELHDSTGPLKMIFNDVAADQDKYVDMAIQETKTLLARCIANKDPGPR